MFGGYRGYHIRRSKVSRKTYDITFKNQWVANKNTQVEARKLVDYLVSLNVK